MKYIISICVVLFVSQSFAQDRTTIPVKLTNTPRGIFVEFGHKSLVGRSVELWRKAGSETAFKMIATLKAPEDPNEVVRKIEESKLVFVEGARPVAKDLDAIWQSYKNRKENALIALSVVPQLEYVFGLAYMDTETRPNEKYQYQIVENRTPIAESTVLNHLRYRKFPKLIATDFSKDNKMIRLEFGFPNELQLSARLQVQRKVFTAPNTEYQQIAPDVSFTTNKNKQYIMSVLDTSLTTYGAYNYRIKVADIWGNADSSYSYFEANNILEAQLPEITKIKTESSKEQRALIISWEMPDNEIMQSLKLYRSTEPNGKYKVVANLNGKDKTVTDPIEVANELYHYYFVTTDVFGNTRRSIRFHAIYDAVYKPSAPINLNALTTKEGVSLNWQSSDFHTRGYYVFRRQGLNGEFIQVSPLLTQASYLDTTSLTSDYTHFYAVKAESDTYDKSNFSDTVSHRPAIVSPKNVLKPPFDLNASFRDGKVRISWENLNAEIPEVLGYQVYRKKASERDYQLVTNKALPFMHNYFVDSTFLSEEVYEYAVVSTDLNDAFSDKSQPAIINLEGRFVMVPLDMGVEIRQNGILLKWTEIEVSRIKQIRIYRAENNGDFKVLSNIKPALKEWLDTAVGKGKSYVYQISTIDLAGKESQRSEPLLVGF